MGNEVPLWVFLAVGRDRKVVDDSERGGWVAIGREIKEERMRERERKKYVIDPKLFSLLGYFSIFFNDDKQNSAYYLIL